MAFTDHISGVKMLSSTSKRRALLRLSSLTTAALLPSQGDTNKNAFLWLLNNFYDYTNELKSSIKVQGTFKA